ncbi:4'-phosphopantetheinyl transferase superfamily protein [Tsukamurella soli]|uniref:Holo-[acyl-carrier-protein] synthase n=1 Tax=Tsukamurella soli TaxID=644556 RepID=A0ABP8JY56_9ACTN
MTPPVAVGCDIVAIDEIRSSIAAFGEKYLARVFTERERAESSGADGVARLAARYAAKEAALKALAITDLPTPPRTVETVLDGGVPRLVLHGDFATRARELGYEHLAVSLSHTDCHAVAVVVAARSADFLPSARDGVH